MIEITVRQHLLAALDVPVVFEVPEQRPAKFIVLQKLGGGRENFLRRASVAVQSQADTLFGAAELHERAMAAMDTLPERDGIHGLHIMGDADFTDPDDKQYRYQAIYDIYYQED